MKKQLLIDAQKIDETRIAVINDGKVEEFEHEQKSTKTLRGNIYLAKITRIEPSLQAAFVEFGNYRHGFLVFDEVHPDNYKIPGASTDSKQAVDSKKDSKKKKIDTKGASKDSDKSSDSEPEKPVFQKRYKIQEVLKRGQVLLIQVLKDERGNKGAAVTTYISLAGRYCVLMPNSLKGGGISRKIKDLTDRNRLKKIVSELSMPEEMALIIRTAGTGKTKNEIKKDVKFLLKSWNEIRDTTLKSIAPSLIHEESNLIRRAIRDLFKKDIQTVLIQGEESHKEAKNYMKRLTPTHAKYIKKYSGKIPIFHKYKIEKELNIIFSPQVKLKSGGYLVINPTEALVAIDVNSGQSTKERNIEKTALNTNLEAAEEVARQVKIRDLAGLIVIDFIDMQKSKHNRMVENCLKSAIRGDRARSQIGRISRFGLLELSRQRMRESMVKWNLVLSLESFSKFILKNIEDKIIEEKRFKKQIVVHVPIQVSINLLKNYKSDIKTIEARYKVIIKILGDINLSIPKYEISLSGKVVPTGRKSKRVKKSRKPRTKNIKTKTIEKEKKETVPQPTFTYSVSSNEKKYIRS